MSLKMNLLGADGDLDQLRRSLCLSIENGETALDAPALIAHLWATTLGHLSIDNPKYAGYRRALTNAQQSTGPTK